MAQQPHPSISAAVAAAREGDLATLHALVDWRLGSPVGAGLAEAGAGLPEAHRADRRLRTLARTLADLDDTATLCARSRAFAARPLAAALRAHTAVTPAPPEAAARVLAAMQIPEVHDDGPAPSQLARLAELREQARGIGGVHLVATPTGQVALGVSAEGLLVLAPRTPDAPASVEDLFGAVGESAFDPDSGLPRDPYHPDPHPLVLPTRGRDEAELYLGILPCRRCLAADTAWRARPFSWTDGRSTRRYEGVCNVCQRIRIHVFCGPEATLAPDREPGEPAYFGGAAPSALLDAEQWLRWAETAAERAVTDPDPVAASTALLDASAAVGEVLKFFQADDPDWLPFWALWTAGDAFQGGRSKRFNPGRLAEVRQHYFDSGISLRARGTDRR
jgi:hypothetical protein